MSRRTQVTPRAASFSVEVVRRVVRAYAQTYGVAKTIELLADIVSDPPRVPLQVLGRRVARLDAHAGGSR